VYYCSQFNAGANPPVNHCRGGMVGVINGLGNRTFEAYQNLAKEVTSVGNPSGGVKGGAFEALQATSPSPSGSGGNGGNPATTSTGSQPSNTSGSGAGTMGVSFGALAAAGAFAAALAL